MRCEGSGQLEAAASGGHHPQGVELIRITRQCYDQTVRQVQVPTNMMHRYAPLCSIVHHYASYDGIPHSSCAGTSHRSHYRRLW
jgi:hypothetical protein